jgi:hypothetical protein
MSDAFKVYDSVWTMMQGKPAERVVFAVVHSMALEKGGKVETHYQLTKSQVGAGWGTDEGVRRAPSEVFATKAELLAAFVAEHTADPAPES